MPLATVTIVPEGEALGAVRLDLPAHVHRLPVALIPPNVIMLMAVQTLAGPEVDARYFPEFGSPMPDGSMWQAGSEHDVIQTAEMLRVLDQDHGITSSFAKVRDTIETLLDEVPWFLPAVEALAITLDERGQMTGTGRNHSALNM